MVKIWNDKKVLMFLPGWHTVRLSGIPSAGVWAAGRITYANLANGGIAFRQRNRWNTGLYFRSL